MQTTAHAARPQVRATGLLFALLLQVGLVTALVKGLDIKVWPMPPLPPLKVALVPTDHPVLPPPPVHTVEPQRIVVIRPDFTLRDDADPRDRIHPDAQPDRTTAGPADRGPLSIMATHTTPPYPALQQRLGVEGTVVLRLTISAEGLVTDAVVVRSSGDEGLDRAARQWVIAHWRYQPAIRGGVAVPATGTVGVQFNLRNQG